MYTWSTRATTRSASAPCLPGLSRVGARQWSAYSRRTAASKRKGENGSVGNLRYLLGLSLAIDRDGSAGADFDARPGRLGQEHSGAGTAPVRGRGAQTPASSAGSAAQRLSRRRRLYLESCNSDHLRGPGAPSGLHSAFLHELEEEWILEVDGLIHFRNVQTRGLAHLTQQGGVAVRNYPSTCLGLGRNDSVSFILKLTGSYNPKNRS